MLKENRFCGSSNNRKESETSQPSLHQLSSVVLKTTTKLKRLPITVEKYLPEFPEGRVSCLLVQERTSKPTCEEMRKYAYV